MHLLIFTLCHHGIIGILPLSEGLRVRISLSSKTVTTASGASNNFFSIYTTPHLVTVTLPSAATVTYSTAASSANVSPFKVTVGTIVKVYVPSVIPSTA